MADYRGAMAIRGEDTVPVAPPPPEGVDDERILTFGLLIEAHARLTRETDHDLQVSDGISLQTFEVLLRVSRAPEGHVTMTGLADGLALTTGGVTRLADRLEADGLVQRVSCPTDRRVVHLMLTDEGNRVLAGAVAHHLDSLQRHLASRVDPGDLPVLHRVLDTLRRPPQG